MTEQQFREQLGRLKMYGNITEDDYPEYKRVLMGIGYTVFVRAIDYLIENHDRHSFPLPAEIHKTTKAIITESTAQKNQQDIERRYSGIDRPTKDVVAWSQCFRLGWLIKDEVKRRYFWENRLTAVTDAMPMDDQVKYYSEVLGEMKAYLTAVGINYKPYLKDSDEGMCVVANGGGGEDELGF